MLLNYYEIGQRIRRFRKAMGFSQEYLAEKAGISTTHMSHIETGNTKLSLPVLVDLAAALGANVDTLLFDTPQGQKSTAFADVRELLERCSPEQTRVIADIVQSAKTAMDKYM